MNGLKIGKLLKFLEWASSFWIGQEKAIGHPGSVELILYMRPIMKPIQIKQIFPYRVIISPENKIEEIPCNVAPSSADARLTGPHSDS